MRPITFICAYYLNRGMLIEQQNVWRDYPADLKPHFHSIVTDDLSPEQPALEAFQPVGIASQQLYRAGQHRRWDWLFCRNLGVEKATTDWVLLTDIDHVLPAATLRQLVSMPLETDQIYRFTRVDAHHPWPWEPGSLTPYKQHPNSWLMTKAMFEQMGGYDERFSGYYGSDSDFRERCTIIPHNAATTPARAVTTLPFPLVRYPREVIPDASTVADDETVQKGLGYQRKAKEDGVHVPRIKTARAKIVGWRPERLTISHVLEASC